MYRLYPRRRPEGNIYITTLWAVAISLIMLWLTRFIFVLYNYESVGSPGIIETLRLSWHGLRFDISAVLYFEILFIAMRILPFKFVYNHKWLTATAWVYGVCTALLIAVNVADIPYYSFTGARLRWANVLTIGTDKGILNVIAGFAMPYWWAYLLGIILIGVTIWLGGFYRTVKPVRFLPMGWRIGIFVFVGLLCFAGMRGRVGKGNPLSIADAAFMVETPPEINAVLNSPFTLLRSLNVRKNNSEPVLTFFSEEEIKKLRNSVHQGAGPLKRRNYMIIMIESGGAEWIDGLSVLGPHHAMPFLDSLLRKSTVVENVFACGRSSVGGTTAVLGGFPAFEPVHFMLSPYNQNTIDTPARLLGAEGWHTAFFYGCAHGSFNIDQTAYAMGYKTIVDLDTYGINEDYDGTWGVFDYPMAERVVTDLNSIQKPFLATWFTITSHGPFVLPEGWDTSHYYYKQLGAEQVLEYTDEAIRHFFDLASRQPWYANTTFIITGDHGNREFIGQDVDGDYIRNRVPFILYAPDGSIPARRIADRTVSQHDIPVTLLTLAGYDKSFVSLGSDMLAEDYSGYAIFRTDGGRYFLNAPGVAMYLSPDMKTVEEVYDTTADPMLKNPVPGYSPETVARMQRWAQAFMQDYTTRLNRNRMSVAKEK